MPEINDLKRELRKKYRAIRNSLSKTERYDADKKIISRLIETEDYRSAKVVLTYVSTGSEVGTEGLIVRSLTDGKKVACPLCDKADHTMSFRFISSVDDLSEGAYGIFEPRPDAPEVQADEMPESICIVPGLSFDASGGRLGYGGGYYDRFLAGYKGVSIGLCYENCQSEELLPGDSFDISVDRVICS